MEKKAFSPAMLANGLSTAQKVLGGAMALGMSGVFLKGVLNKINNDVTRKRIIEDLALNDPLLKSVDRNTLLEWYASIYHYAPTLSKDKHTVAEVLRNFARFNKIDLNTLKMLADTEKSVNDSGKGMSVGTDIMRGFISLPK